MYRSDMDDAHLANAIAKIERSRRWRREWLARLYLEQDIRRVQRGNFTLSI
jgi:hypothetical protein